MRGTRSSLFAPRNSNEHRAQRNITTVSCIKHTMPPVGGPPPTTRKQPGMTLSILLTPPWDVRVDAMPHRIDVPKVAPHRFSWKRAGMVGHPRGPWQVFPQRPDTSDDGGVSDEAEVIVPGTDEELFASLHGVLARDANYDAVVACIGGDDRYAGIVDTLRAIGAQHPDAMWLVHAWWVDSAVE